MSAYEEHFDDGRVRCLVCPNRCVLKENARGRCFVRRNSGGTVVCDTYGIPAGLAVDPIEKKPLYHFLPGSDALSFGTEGCNLSCRFCQNWHLSHPDRLHERKRVSPEQIAAAARTHGCASVAFTYNEPVIILEYVRDCAAACHEVGIRTVAVTSGYVEGRARRDFFGRIDAANVDLKAFTDGFYRRLCGVHLQPVLDTLVYLRRETSVWLEITNLLIPGENDSDAELDRMTRWIAAELGRETPVHFTAFHPDGEMLDHPRTPLQTLHRARAIARENGLQHIYTGNVIDPDGSSTFCAECGAVLIRRGGFSCAATGLTAQGACSSCGTICAGVFA